MRMVLLDRARLQAEVGAPVDLSPLEQCGELVVYEETPPLESFNRVAGAEILLTVAVPVSRMLLDWAPKIKQVVVLAERPDLVDPVAAEDLGVEVSIVTAPDIVAGAAEAIRRARGEHSA